MLNINEFLSKFLKIDKNNSVKLNLITDILKREAGVDLKKENLLIKNDFLKIEANPIFRNEIFLNKEKVEAALKKENIFLKLI